MALKWRAAGARLRSRLGRIALGRSSGAWAFIAQRETFQHLKLKALVLRPKVCSRVLGPGRRKVLVHVVARRFEHLLDMDFARALVLADHRCIYLLPKPGTHNPLAKKQLRPWP